MLEQCCRAAGSTFRTACARSLSATSKEQRSPSTAAWTASTRKEMLPRTAVWRPEHLSTGRQTSATGVIVSRQSDAILLYNDEIMFYKQSSAEIKYTTTKYGCIFTFGHQRCCSLRLRPQPTASTRTALIQVSCLSVLNKKNLWFTCYWADCLDMYTRARESPWAHLLPEGG